MHSATRIAVSAFLITSTLATTYQNTAKLRRNGVLNLYPFPRVGRASQGWALPLDQLMLEYKTMPKRQMYAFPRVGRSDAPLQKELLHLEELPDVQEPSLRSALQRMFGGHGRGYVKRGIESTDKTGMWFGPRLGRAFSNGDDELVINPNNEKSEPEQTDTEQSERDERQT